MTITSTKGLVAKAFMGVAVVGALFAVGVRPADAQVSFGVQFGTPDYGYAAPVDPGYGAPAYGYAPAPAPAYGYGYGYGGYPVADPYAYAHERHEWHEQEERREHYWHERMEHGRGWGYRDHDDWR